MYPRKRCDLYYEYRAEHLEDGRADQKLLRELGIPPGSQDIDAEAKVIGIAISIELDSRVEK